MAHKSEEEIVNELEAAKQEITVGGVYSHYKHPELTYKVTGLGLLEATDEPCVIYQAQYGANITFVRAVSVWLETVEWNGQTVPRFTKL